jgi:hypothetical protein
LHGFSHRKVEVIDFFASDKANSPNDKGSTATVVPFHEENFLPQPKVGLNAQKRFAKG